MWKHSKCALRDEWIKKMWSSHTTEYYLFSKRNEILTQATTWMNLEDIMRCEISQSQKDKHCMIPFTRTVKFIETESGTVVVRGLKRENREWLFYGDSASALEDERVLGMDGGTLKNNVNVLNATELYTWKWLKCQILCMYILPKLKNKTKSTKHNEFLTYMIPFSSMCQFPHVHFRSAVFTLLPPGQSLHPGLCLSMCVSLSGSGGRDTFSHVPKTFYPLETGLCIYSEVLTMGLAAVPWWEEAVPSNSESPLISGLGSLLLIFFSELKPLVLSPVVLSLMQPKVIRLTITCC